MTRGVRPFWVDGHVYIGNDKAKMLVFKHGKEKKLVNTIDMNCGYIRNTPVVVNGVMYFITENPTQKRRRSQSRGGRSRTAADSGDWRAGSVLTGETRKKSLVVPPVANAFSFLAKVGWIDDGGTSGLLFWRQRQCPR